MSNEQINQQQEEQNRMMEQATNDAHQQFVLQEQNRLSQQAANDAHQQAMQLQQQAMQMHNDFVHQTNMMNNNNFN